MECVRQIKTKINVVRLKNPLPLRTARVPSITLPSLGFGCCTPRTTSSPRHHIRDPPPSQVRLPPVIRPCPPAKDTYCSRVLSLHTFHRVSRCNCRCSGPQPCIGSISPTEPSLSAPPFELALPLPPSPSMRLSTLPTVTTVTTPSLPTSASDFDEPFDLPKDERSVSYLLWTRFIISLRS